MGKSTFGKTTLVLLLLLVPLDGKGGQTPGSAIVVYDAKFKVVQLSKEALRAVFFMRERTWPNGAPIQVFVLPDDHPIHQRFAKEVLGAYPFQLRTVWLVYSGTGQAPTQVNTLEEMLKRLQTTPGAIGYVLQEQPHAH